MSKVLFGSSLGFVVLPLLLIAQSPSSGPYTCRSTNTDE